jgi:hypothetical protein
MSNAAVAILVASAAAWLNGNSAVRGLYGSNPVCYVDLDANHAQRRRNVAAWFVACGGSAAVGGAFAQACFTTSCHAWLYDKGGPTGRYCPEWRAYGANLPRDPLAVRILRSWPTGAPGPATLELPGSCAASDILTAAAACHPASIRAVSLPLPEAWYISKEKASTQRRCVPGRVDATAARVAR